MRRSLPPEVFHFCVLPDLLSEHLHRYLLFSESPQWNPFSTLPLVSRHFHKSCHALCVNIFGLTQGEGGLVIKNILGVAKTLWDQANLPPRNAAPVRPHTFQQLMSSDSLIQVYICAAIAKCYLNRDVLFNTDMEQSRRAGLNEVDKDIIVDDNPLATRRYKMRDHEMHRVYLPFACALKLCDRVRPERMAYIVADYLAAVTPLFVTAPMMLKCAQDLEMAIDRDHLDLEIYQWVSRAYQTFKHIETMPELVHQNLKMGKLVQSFQYSSDVPLEVINGTDILLVLDNVTFEDWGADTADIWGLAIMIRERLLENHEPGDEVEEESYVS